MFFTNKSHRLFEAVQQADDKKVEELLKRGVSVDAMEKGFTALHVAAMNGHFEIVCLLIRHGANVNAKTPTGWTALMDACGRGHTAVVTALVEAGADVNCSDRDAHTTALMTAATLGRRDIVRFLLGRGAHIHAQDVQGRTALECAKLSGDNELVALLQRQVPR